MKTDFRWTFAAIALLAAGCNKADTTASTAPGGSSALPAAVPPPSGQDWTETVSATPEGGFRMGNPDAKVKLVEYASLTCPHCAAFASESATGLTDQIRAGRVSYEYRNFMLNGIDVVASLLARCQGPGPFFKLVEQVYAEQPNWVPKFQQITPAEQARIQALPTDQQPLATAKAGQLIDFFRARGLPEAKAEACLTDKAGMDTLEALQKRGSEQDGVTGTPSFLINGKPVANVASWDLLKPQIDSALAG
jgi:protein-disulfide isomerase